ncbi:MAG: alpha/beta hydrolase [Burkholderiales bacterium]|nr:alpha/beta hydrolase [Burkholderiales bacterium]
MPRVRERVLIPGDAGDIETVLDLPGAAARGIAVVAHPHPLYGGTLDNKVVQTLARALCELGYAALRPNFRGVGASAGAHDRGEGETADLLRVAAFAAHRFGRERVVLAGFSFGACVQARVAQALLERARGAPALALERLVLVGLAAGTVAGERSYAPPAVPAGTVVIHGELDETVPLSAVFAWARPQELPVVVIPGADHFFHRRLHLIRSIVTGAWRA